MRPARIAMVIVVVVAVALLVRELTGSDRERRDRTPAADTATARAGWERVEPGGRTRTARGAPYAFWVRRGDPRRLLLFFQEGGGCFSYEMCARGSRFFDDAVDASDDPSTAGGVLDGLDSRNPLRDHTTVFIPSATGDVHWGDARVRYRSGSRRITVEHRGFVNAMAAVRWAFRHVPDPRSVLVTGCSAGSVRSAAFAPYVIRRYPPRACGATGRLARVRLRRPHDLSDIRAYANMPRWIPAVRPLRPGRHTMADYYVAIAQRYPDATFAQINYFSDAVQREFYAAAGAEPAGFDTDLRAALDGIHAGAPNFRSYLARASITACSRFRRSTRSTAAACRCATGPRASRPANRSPTCADRRPPAISRSSDLVTFVGKSVRMSVEERGLSELISKPTVGQDLRNEAREATHSGRRRFAISGRPVFLWAAELQQPARRRELDEDHEAGVRGLRARPCAWGCSCARLSRVLVGEGVLVSADHEHDPWRAVARRGIPRFGVVMVLGPGLRAGGCRSGGVGREMAAQAPAVLR